MYPNTKYSWCLKIQELLSSVDYLSIWNKNSANFLYSSRSSILNKLRQNLRAAVLRLANTSTTVPHYSSIVSKPRTCQYLRQNFPSYLVTCIAQIRLDYSNIFNSGKWYDLAMFDGRLCSVCVEQESFSHIFECVYSFWNSGQNSAIPPSFLWPCSSFCSQQHKYLISNKSTFYYNCPQEQTNCHSLIDFVKSANCNLHIDTWLCCGHIN